MNPKLQGRQVNTRILSCYIGAIGVDSAKSKFDRAERLKCGNADQQSRLWHSTGLELGSDGQQTCPVKAGQQQQQQ